MYTIDFNHPSSLYFVGIGGISMSGMALLLQDAGFQVCGSDRSPSAATEMLEAQGITVFYGQRAENMTEAGRIDCVVFTAATRTIRNIRRPTPGSSLASPGASFWARS